MMTGKRITNVLMVAVLPMGIVGLMTTTDRADSTVYQDSCDGRHERFRRGP